MRVSHGCEARFLRPWMVVLAVIAGIPVGTPTATAAPISGHRHTARTTDFQKFLAGGPTHWMTHHLEAVPSGVKILAHDGSLVHHRVVDYLMWERDRHPIAFDRHHPNVGPKLAALQDREGSTFMVSHSARAGSTAAESIHAYTSHRHRATVAAEMLAAPSVALQTMEHTSLPTPRAAAHTLHRQISSSSVVSTRVYEAQQLSLQGSPEPIPEPSSIAIAIVLLGSATCWNRWSARGRRDRATS